MRAIEKNILVVSTREPGPIARRGETGDGMVNGSVEEDAASVTQQQPPPPPPSPSPSLSPSQLPSSPSQPPQTTQPVQPTSQDVEMEYWEKDCTSTVTISVHTVTENEPPLLHNDVPPTSPLTKSVFTETSREKLEQASSRTEIAPSNYISAASEFSSVSNLTSQSHEAVLPNVSAVPIVQNLPAVGTIMNDKVTSDSSVSATDIAEVIMNEDTNSQPNLDIENEEIEAATIASSTTTTATTISTLTTATTAATTTATSTTSAATTTVTVVATVIPLTTDTTRNLQAAFQAKRFESDSDNKCLDNKSDEKAPIQSTIISVEDEGVGHSMKSEETALNKLNSECVDSNEMSCNENRLTENLLQTDIDMRSDALENNIESNNMKEINAEEVVSNKPEEESTSVLEDTDKENLGSKNNDKIKTAMFDESELAEKDNTITSEECMSAVIVSNSEALYKPEKTEMHSKEVSVMISSKESFIHDQSISQKTENTEVTDNVIEAVPRVASPNSNDNEQEVEVPELNTDNLKVMEVSNDKAPLVESMISLPVSTIEKPKEATSVIEKFAPVSPTVEMTESSDISCQSLKDEKLTEVQDDSSTNVQDNKTICITTKENQSSVIESVICLKEHESTELMEVDEESLSTFQQDEPMEQETMEELSKS